MNERVDKILAEQAEICKQNDIEMTYEWVERGGAFGRTGWFYVDIGNMQMRTHWMDNYYNSEIHFFDRNRNGMCVVMKEGLDILDVCAQLRVG